MTRQNDQLETHLDGTRNKKAMSKSVWRRLLITGLWILIAGGLTVILTMIARPANPTSFFGNIIRDVPTPTAVSLTDSASTVSISTQQGRVQQLQWSATDKTLVAVTSRQIIFYDASLRELKRWSFPQILQVNAVHYGAGVAFVESEYAGIYRISREQPPERFIDQSDIRVSAASAMGEVVALVTEANELQVWDTNSGELMARQVVSDTLDAELPAARLMLDTTGTQLAVMTFDKVLGLWTVGDGGLRHQHTWQITGFAQHLSFSHDNDVLMMAYGNQFMQQSTDEYDLSRVASVPGTLIDVHVMYHSGQWFMRTLTGLYRHDPKMRETQQIMFPPLYGNTAQITFAPDGSRFATIERGRGIHVWEVTQEHEATVITSLSFADIASGLLAAEQRVQSTAAPDLSDRTPATVTDEQIHDATMTVRANMQHFERGIMVYVSTTGIIYVLIDNGQVMSYLPEQYGQLPLNTRSASEGFVAPIMGFGRIYAGDDTVRDALGRATHPEISFDMPVASEGSDNLYMLPLNNRIYSIDITNNTWREADVLPAPMLQPTFVP